MSRKSFFVLLLFVFAIAKSQDYQSAKVITPHINPAIKFTENLGQWDNKILFRAQLDGGKLYVENQCLTFNFYDKKKYRSLHHGRMREKSITDSVVKCHAYKVHFVGANSTPLVQKMQQGFDYENFFIGNDKTKWKGEVRNYNQIWLKNLYNGIDYEMISSVNGLKYNFHVEPNANPELIKLKYEGVNDLKLRDGKLITELTVNEIIEQKPYAYQLINGVVKEVKCKYVLKNNSLTFQFPNGYNKNHKLVIDPVLVFAAQSGSTADNWGMTATYDAAGNLYSGGIVFDNGYPTTTGAYLLNFVGVPNPNNPYQLNDIVITKYNPTGNSLLYSTYIGGTGYELISSLIVDHNNNLCFFGTTGSTNFPTTTGAYDNTFNGGLNVNITDALASFPLGTDIFIGKFNTTGTSLMACTYYGGTGNDGLNYIAENQTLQDSLMFNYGDHNRGEIQIDLINNIYIASSSRSSNLPMVNSADNTLGGKQDAIVAKFNSNLSQLIYSTFVGGSKNDCGNSLIVNNNSEVYITGGTSSNNFPTVSGAYNLSYSGGKADGFITHISSSGNSFLHSTLFGTSNYDQSYFIQSDKNNNIYVYGQSLGNMPVIASGTLSLYSNPGRHQFITRFNSILSSLNLSTVFGSNLNDIDISPSAFSVDKCGNIYLSGWGGRIGINQTFLGNMPLLNATQTSTDGHDFYLMGLSTNASSLLYGSYFGGSLSDEHVDGGTSRFDSRGVMYQSVCAGCGGNDDFPVTPGAWPNTPFNPNKSTNCNNGVFKVNFQLLVAVSTINTNTLAGCAPATISFSNATAPTGPNSSFTWYSSNGTTNSTVINPNFTFNSPGVYTIALVVRDPTACNEKDSSITYVTIYSGVTANLSATSTPCTNTVNLSGSYSGTLGNTPPTFNLGDGSPTSTLLSIAHTYTNNGVYTVSYVVTDNLGCQDLKTIQIPILNFKPSIVTEQSVCAGSSGTLSAEGGTQYTWTPSASLNTNNIANPIANPSANTVYTVQILNNSYGLNCSNTLTTQIIVQPTPVSSFTYKPNSCGGGVDFKDESFSEISSWLWTLSSTKTSTIQNPYFFYESGGTHTVSLQSTNVYGCKNISDKIITIEPPPPLAISGSTQICIGNKFPLNASGGTAYQWTPTLSIDLPLTSAPIASPLISTEYSVIISTTKIVDNKACDFMLTTFVDVSVLSKLPPKAVANPRQVTIGNASTLNYIGDEGAYVSWLPETSPSMGYSVQAYPKYVTTYTAFAVKGACSETITVVVDAFTPGCIDDDVFIPNTFTPNNDTKNDKLFVRGLKVDEVYFAIYNRWGELIFETTDKSEGWDGNYKSKQAEVGVYGWYLKVKCINGIETFKKGNITLIR